MYFVCVYLSIILLLFVLMQQQWDGMAFLFQFAVAYDVWCVCAFLSVPNRFAIQAKSTTTTYIDNLRVNCTCIEFTMQMHIIFSYIETWTHSEKRIKTKRKRFLIISLSVLGFIFVFLRFLSLCGYFCCCCCYDCCVVALFSMDSIVFHCWGCCLYLCSMIWLLAGIWIIIKPV